MNIRRITLAAGAATGGVLAAGFLQTAVAFAAPVTGEDPFTIFGTGAAGSADSQAELNALDALLDSQSASSATTLATDAQTAVTDLNTGTAFTTTDTGAPTTDNAFVELLPAGTAQTSIAYQDAVALDQVLYTLDPTEAPTLAAAAAAPGVPAVGDTLNLFGDPTGNPTITAVNGIPPEFQDAIGTQSFTVTDTTAQGSTVTPVDVGVLNADYSQYTFSGGSTNTEYTVTSYAPDSSALPAFTGVPGDGSVYDVFNFGSGLENVYSDVLTGSGTTATSTVTDILEYNGTTLLNLTPLVDAFGINPADFTL